MMLHFSKKFPDIVDTNKELQSARKTDLVEVKKEAELVLSTAGDAGSRPQLNANVEAAIASVCFNHKQKAKHLRWMQR